MTLTTAAPQRVGVRRARDSAWFVPPAALLVGLLGIPLAGLIWVALTGGLGTYLGDAQVHAAVRLSLVTSALAVGLIVVTGLPLAYLLARWRFPGRSLVILLIDLPIVLPPMVAGIALLEVFGRNGWLGGPLAALGISLPFTTTAVVLSQVFVAGPFFVRAARIGFEEVDPAIQEAARVDKASEFGLFWHIMVPVARRAILTGLVLAWARALGEFGATLFFAGNREGVTQTMPLAIFIGFESNLALAVGLSFVLLVISTVVLLVVGLLGGDRTPAR
ncbi:ABC transporter permease [Granulicoccus sp. GXG6511]|uniref:ABC transporter permease n=1 Tax=Granulicoccus sp. GXG6511 TaxID=3381351 RepID=UPI003D7CE3EC